MKALLIFAAVSHVFGLLVAAYPSGAGDCRHGEPSIGGSHAWRLPRAFGTNNQISVTMDGTDISSSDLIKLALGQDHQVVIETGGFFRGFLMVASKCEASWSIPADQQANVQDAWACDSDSPGVCHSHSGDKQRVEATLRIDHLEEWSRLDVNVVLTNTAPEGSNWQYSGWKIRVREAIPEPPSPTSTPTVSPTREPTRRPTTPPTRVPTQSPTSDPSPLPTPDPTYLPTFEPTFEPTSEPTSEPSSGPSCLPSVSPSVSPSGEPTISPSTVPSHEPTTSPTSQPTPKPTDSPTDVPTPMPTPSPTMSPTRNPTDNPTVQLPKVTAAPSTAPTAKTTSVGEQGVNTASPSTSNVLKENEPETDPSRSPSLLPSTASSVSPRTSTSLPTAHNTLVADSKQAPGTRAKKSASSTIEIRRTLLLLTWFVVLI